MRWAGCVGLGLIGAKPSSASPSSSPDQAPSSRAPTSMARARRPSQQYWPTISMRLEEAEAAHRDPLEEERPICDPVAETRTVAADQNRDRLRA